MTTQRVCRTKLVLRDAGDFQRPSERLLAETDNQLGLSYGISELGLMTATMTYWMLKLGISYRKVTITAEETIEEKPQGKS